MAGEFQPTNVASGKPVTEKKKRKRPSKKVPTTVLETSSNNFMDLVQKLTGSEAELATSKAEEKRPKSNQGSPGVSETSSYLHNYLQNSIYNNNSNNHNNNSNNHNNNSNSNDNDSSSSSQHSNYGAASLPMSHFMAKDPSSGYKFGGDGFDEELYQSGGFTGGASNSASSRAMENVDLSLSNSWRDPASHPDYWYHQMDAMRA